MQQGEKHARIPLKLTRSRKKHRVISMRLINNFPIHLLLLLALFMGQAAAVEKVVLQLKWQHQFQFAGYYAAIAKGYYQQLGLEVELREAKSGQDPTSEVLAGHAQYGVATSDLVLLQARGEPVVVLAPIFQHSAQVILARRDRGLNTVHDLVGHRLAIEPQSAELLALFQKEGLNEKDIQQKAHTFDPGDLVGGRVDAMSAYSTDEPFLLREAGIDTTIFSPRSGGIDFYGDTLFTTQSELQNHPERVRALLAASLKGWQYAMQHPDEIIDLILREYSPRHSRQHLQFEAAETARLIQSPLVEIGHNNPGRWRHMAETYFELGLLPDGNLRKGFIFERDSEEEQRSLWLALGGASLLVLFFGGLALSFFRLSRRLKHEIHERSEVEKKLRWRMAAVESAADGILITDLNGKILYSNPALSRMSGFPDTELLGQTPRLFRSGTHAPEHYAKLWETISAGRTWQGEMLNRRRDGSLYDEAMTISPVFDSYGKIERYVAIKRDITQEKEAAAALSSAKESLEKRLSEISQLHEMLAEQVIRDPLTYLYNRRYLDDTLPREVARARRDGYPLTIAMIDIDHFKNINDTYGHAAGDQVIRVLAGLLQANARDGDIASRYGGEEFVLLLPNLDAEDALRRAEEWRSQFAGHLIVHGKAEIAVTLSIGLATYPDHLGDAMGLMASADHALYQAKRNGRNQVALFLPG